MRISDWSSDVCSSDLWLLGRIWVVLTPSGGYRAGDRAFDDLGGVPQALAPVRAEGVVPPDPFAPVQPAGEPPGVAVGRAAGRGRVCRLVLISGVAVSVTKIKENTDRKMQDYEI